MLPPTFVVTSCEEDVADFVCDKCNTKVPSRTIEEIMIQYQKELTALKRTEFQNLSKFIDLIERQKRIFHEAHGNIFAVKIEIATAISKTWGLSPSVLPLEDRMNYFEEVTARMKILMPSESKFIYEICSSSYLAYFSNLLIHKHLCNSQAKQQSVEYY